MKLLLPVTIIASILAVNVKAIWKPAPGTTWNYVLGDENFDVTKETAEVIEVDYESNPELIEYYHSYGKKVICYFSGGTLESFRKDYDDYAAVDGLIKNAYSNWSNERWLDLRVDGLKDLVEKRIEVSISKNCDAIEVDNMDGYQSPDVEEWTNPLTPQDNIDFARWIADKAHELGISVGIKNVPGILSELTDYFDFAINESCFRYHECNVYKDFAKSGKAIFGISYGEIDDIKEDLCNEINGLGFSMIVKPSQDLSQKGTKFDVDSVCGSGYSSGYVYTPSTSTTSSSSLKKDNENTKVIEETKDEDVKVTEETKKGTKDDIEEDSDDQDDHDEIKEINKVTNDATNYVATANRNVTPTTTKKKVTTVTKNVNNNKKKTLIKKIGNKYKKVIVVIKTVTRSRKMY